MLSDEFIEISFQPNQNAFCADIKESNSKCMFELKKKISDLLMKSCQCGQFVDNAEKFEFFFIFSCDPQTCGRLSLFTPEPTCDVVFTHPT